MRYGFEAVAHRVVLVVVAIGDSPPFRAVGPTCVTAVTIGVTWVRSDSFWHGDNNQHDKNKCDGHPAESSS